MLTFVLYVGEFSFKMADLNDFVEAPRLTLNRFTKDQLLKVADHYSIGISDKKSSYFCCSHNNKLKWRDCV